MWWNVKLMKSDVSQTQFSEVALAEESTLKKLVTPRNLQFIIKSFQAILIQGICKKIQQIDITSKDFTYFFKIKKTCNDNLGGIIVYILIKYKEYLIH